MARLHINYQVYLSLSCLIDDMSKLYTNQIITRLEHLEPLKKSLEMLNFHPNIYVVTNNPEDVKKNNNSVKYYSSYHSVIEALVTRSSQRRSSLMKYIKQRKKKNIILKIFRNNQLESSQEIIFQETLKAKKISYEIYKNFADLERSLETTTSNCIVTDYVFHKEVINLVSATPTRVICFCDFEKTESYDPRTYFITNNFLEIVSEVSSEEKLRNLNTVKCSKVYMYANKDSYLCDYVPIL